MNVGTLLGTVENSSTGAENKVKEVSNYKPPQKEKKESIPKVFDEEKVSKKIKKEQPILKLEEEEPLILNQIHEENLLKSQKRVSPAARKMANEAKVDLSSIEDLEKTV